MTTERNGGEPVTAPLTTGDGASYGSATRLAAHYETEYGRVTTSVEYSFMVSGPLDRLGEVEMAAIVVVLQDDEGLPRSFSIVPELAEVLSAALDTALADGTRTRNRSRNNAQ